MQMEHKFSRGTALGDKCHSSSHSSSASPSSVQKIAGKKEDLASIPSTCELAFYVAVESSKEVKDIWDDIVKRYIASNSSKSTKPDDSLGALAQLLFNSTQARFDRLAKIIDGVKEHTKRSDSHFIAIYNFYGRQKARFYEVLQTEAERQRWSTYDNLPETCLPAYYDSGLFRRYVKCEDLTSLVLDSAFNGRACNLPKCIFTASNLEKLSLKENNLRSLPADIGRLGKLTCLQLSHNRLKNDSIPYTLSYCTELTTLHIDYNILDAVPGFVLNLKKLKTLHRHGNQNYFRSTFMWYGCENRERIRTASFSDVDVAAIALTCATEVQSAMFWAARTIVSSKANYFLLPGIPETLKDYISSVYSRFNICAACHTANLLHSQGYFVFTFHNPFVGNTCVPFQHWTCSRECALSIEIPARKQQVKMAKQQRKAYDSQIRLFSRQPDTIPEVETSAAGSNAFPSERRRTHRKLRCNIM